MNNLNVIKQMIKYNFTLITQSKDYDFKEKRDILKVIHDYETLVRTTENKEAVLLYTTSPNCSVCHADYPKVERIAEQYRLECLHIDITEIKKAAGQLNLFSSPTVVLYLRGKEFHRQARIIDFDILGYQIKQMTAYIE